MPCGKGHDLFSSSGGRALKGVELVQFNGGLKFCDRRARLSTGRASLITSVWKPTEELTAFRRRLRVFWLRQMGEPPSLTEMSLLTVTRRRRKRMSVRCLSKASIFVNATLGERELQLLAPTNSYGTLLLLHSHQAETTWCNCLRACFRNPSASFGQPHHGGFFQLRPLDGSV